MHELPAALAVARASEEEIPISLVERVVRDEYGIDARAERLTGEWDQNFRMRTADDSGFVLKIAHPQEPPDVTDLPAAALVHLEHTEPALPCPRVIRSGGRTRVTFRDANDAARTAFLYTFLPGKTLLSSKRSQPQRAACGQLLARLAHALREFQHPATRRSLIWDLMQLPALEGVLQRLPDMPYRQFCAGFVQQFSTEVLPRLRELRSQPVHNDFNSRNLLVDPDDETRITGIIDFGDLVHTALIADIAVGVIGQLATAQSADEAMLEFVAGYRSIEPLRAEELELLKWLIAGRIVQNVTVTSWYRVHSPGDGHFDAFDADYFEWRIALAERLSRTRSPFL
jgi:Ser/Thr protein kinase RdoA (MazF antagonist)